MTDKLAPLIRTEGLTKRYPDGKVTALDNVTVEILPGEYVAVMGPSGSGKSTLLTLLGALDHPTSGTIFFEGKPLQAWGDLDRFRALKIGFVFQSFHLLPTLTALENVQLPMFETDASRSERVEKARRLLEITSIDHRAAHLPAALSVGERQRVALARALANDPQLLLADEPTGNLDSKTAEEILQLFDKLHREEQMTIITVTHSKEVGARAQRLIPPPRRSRGRVGPFGTNGPTSFPSRQGFTRRLIFPGASWSLPRRGCTGGASCADSSNTAKRSGSRTLDMARDHAALSSDTRDRWANCRLWVQRPNPYRPPTAGSKPISPRRRIRPASARCP